jgi:hypothetical protein
MNKNKNEWLGSVPCENMSPARRSTVPLAQGKRILNSHPRGFAAIHANIYNCIKFLDDCRKWIQKAVRGSGHGLLLTVALTDVRISTVRHRELISSSLKFWCLRILSVLMRNLAVHQCIQGARLEPVRQTEHPPPHFRLYTSIYFQGMFYSYVLVHFANKVTCIM